MEMTPVSARARTDPAPRVEAARLPRSPPGRDLFLDSVRAIAVIRVVTWHAYGWAPITWIVSAVPAMIFVSGHLFAKSASRRPVGVVVRDRLRRLLIPYWAFAASAWLIMIGAHVVTRTPETDLPLRSIPAWILPLNDPRGSVWEGGWLAQPLWYLRVLLLLLLTAPVLWRAARRFPQLTIATLLTATIVLELAELRTNWHPSWAPYLLWKLGDYTLYATFFAFGIAHFHGSPMSAGRSARLAVLCAVLGIGWAITSPPQDWVVNNSHIVHFFIGAAWLSLAFAARAAITAFAERRAVNAVVRGIGRRSLTIYLWHSAAAITTWHLLGRVRTVAARGALVGHRGRHDLDHRGRCDDSSADSKTAPPVERRPPPARAGSPRAARAGPPHHPLRWLSTVAGIAVLGACAAYTLPPAWDEGHGDRPAGGASAFAFGIPEDAPAESAARPPAPRVPSQAPRRPTFDGTSAAAPASTINRAPITLAPARRQHRDRHRRDDHDRRVVDAREQSGRRRPRCRAPRRRRSLDDDVGYRRHSHRGRAGRVCSRGTPRSASTGTAPTSTPASPSTSSRSPRRSPPR